MVVLSLDWLYWGAAARLTGDDRRQEPTYGLAAMQ
jgi:hypothetical protein